MNLQKCTNPALSGTLLTGKCLKSRHFGAGNAKLRAQTTVELAFILIPFFAILFAIVDYAQIYFYENSLQNALRESCRFATAGRIIQKYSNGAAVTVNINGVTYPVPIDDPTHPGRPASRNECIRLWFLSNCVVQVPLTNILILSAPTLPGVAAVTSQDGSTLLQPVYDSNGNIVGSTAANAGPGGQGDYIQIHATYTISTITPVFGIFSGLYTRNAASGTGYPCRVSAIVKNEPALLNFSTNAYPAVYSGEYPGGFPSANQF